MYRNWKKKQWDSSNFINIVNELIHSSTHLGSEARRWSTNLEEHLLKLPVLHVSETTKSVGVEVSFLAFYMMSQRCSMTERSWDMGGYSKILTWVASKKFIQTLATRDAALYSWNIVFSNQLRWGRTYVPTFPWR